MGPDRLAGVSGLRLSTVWFRLVVSGFRAGAGVLPNLLGWCRRSAGGCVLVYVEQVGEMLLGGAHVGEHALHAGPSLAAVVVEQHGFFDAGKFVEQFAYRQV